MKLCKICCLPTALRKKVDRALVDGMSLKNVAKKFSSKAHPFTYGSVNRHRPHVLGKQEPAVNRSGSPRRQAPASSPKFQKGMKERIESLITRFERIAAAGEKNGQLVVSTTALKEMHSCLRTLAQLTGELAGTTINFNNFNVANLREEQVIVLLDGIAKAPPLMEDRMRELVAEKLGAFLPPLLNVEFAPQPESSALLPPQPETTSGPILTPTENPAAEPGS